MVPGAIVIILFVIAAISSCAHGGRLAQATRSKDAHIRAKAYNTIVWMIIIGIVCLMIIAWPLVLALAVIFLLCKILKII
jgi:hypothetical protein